jgi:hypothetical protein
VLPSVSCEVRTMTIFMAGAFVQAFCGSFVVTRRSETANERAWCR